MPKQIYTKSAMREATEVLLFQTSASKAQRSNARKSMLAHRPGTADHEFFRKDLHN